MFSSMSPDARARAIEEQMVLAAKECQSQRMNVDGPRVREIEVEIQRLIQERYRCGNEDLGRRREMCKEIKKLNREKVKWRKEDKIERILLELRGLKDLSSIQAPASKRRITSMIDASEDEKHSKPDIAEVFTVFYENLYAARNPTQHLT